MRSTKRRRSAPAGRAAAPSTDDAGALFRPVGPPPPPLTLVLPTNQPTNNKTNIQNVDTGELLMQAYSDRAAVCETLQTGLATFYSRSRRGRWCKGETSGAYIRVLSVHADCDRDSLVYLGDPIGPACHTGARTCWFKRVAAVPVAAAVEQDAAEEEGAAAAPAQQQQHQERRRQQQEVRDEGESERHGAGAPLTTLLALERTIAERRREAEEDAADPAAPPKDKPSWTARLLADEALLCRKVREEAGELCETLERREGRGRAASEAADLLYHAMVLLNAQEVPFTDVMRVLRKRFGVSGVAEKAARPPISAAKRVGGGTPLL